MGSEGWNFRPHAWLLGRGKGPEVQSANGQWFNQLWLCKEAFIKTQKGWVRKLLDWWTPGDWEEWLSGEGMEAPHPFPRPLPVHLFIWLLILPFVIPFNKQVNVFPWVLWAAAANYGGGHWNLQSAASWSEARVTAWDFRLVSEFGGRRQSYRTEPLTCGIGCHFQGRQCQNWVEVSDTLLLSQELLRFVCVGISLLHDGTSSGNSKRGNTFYIMCILTK